MKFHLFTGAVSGIYDRWNIFLYETPETCVEAWTFCPSAGLKAYKKDTRDIPIEKRIFILSTTQHDRVTKHWNYKEIDETEAYFMMFDAEKEE